jgi:hypothetical protein
MKFPCKDCITLSICRSLVLDRYVNEEFKMAAFLCNRCEEYAEYVIEGMNNDSYDPRVMATLTFFKRY